MTLAKKHPLTICHAPPIHNSPSSLARQNGKLTTFLFQWMIILRNSRLEKLGGRYCIPLLLHPLSYPLPATCPSVRLCLLKWVWLGWQHNRLVEKVSTSYDECTLMCDIVLLVFCVAFFILFLFFMKVQLFSG